MTEEQARREAASEREYLNGYDAGYSQVEKLENENGRLHYFIERAIPFAKHYMSCGDSSPVRIKDAGDWLLAVEALKAKGPQ